ncbi:MAG: hypothetical protein KJ709_07145 [Nanoarchaeota archaeon]|nr:hypothetical protein [Nanoarchaeota archaeon]
MKKRLTQQEEFDIMKLVLDKFLWLGFGVMVYGLWIMATGVEHAFARGLSFIVGGALVLIVFMMIIVREYEVIK